MTLKSQGIHTIDLSMLQPPGGRSFTTRCETCGAATRENKQRCSEHVLELPYAAHVARTWNEIQTAQARRPLPPEVLEEVRLAHAETSSVLGIVKITSLPLGVVEM